MCFCMQLRTIEYGALEDALVTSLTLTFHLAWSLGLHKSYNGTKKKLRRMSHLQFLPHT